MKTTDFRLTSYALKKTTNKQNQTTPLYNHIHNRTGPVEGCLTSIPKDKTWLARHRETNLKVALFWIEGQQQEHRPLEFYGI